MRKIIIWITVIALIVSIVGTGVVVYVETSSIPATTSPEPISTDIMIDTPSSDRVMSGSTLTGDNI